MKPACSTLAALVLAWAPLMAAAHALPPSTVDVTTGPASVGLALTIPQDELAIVLPVVAGADPDAVMPQAVAAAVADYLARHVFLTGAGKFGLDLTVSEIRFATVAQQDLGQIAVVAVDLRADLPAALVGLPLTLRYDAVLHEVRNHSATVTLHRAGGPAVMVGDIRFDPALGRAMPVVFLATP